MTRKPSQPLKRVQKIDPRYKGMVTLESPVFPEDEALNREFAKARPRAEPEYNFVLPTGSVGAQEVQSAVAAAYRPGSSARKAVLPESAVERLNSLPSRSLAGGYSYGGRDYPSFEAAKATNPDMQTIRNPSQGTFIRGQRSGPRADPGDRADRIATAMGYSKSAHDLFGDLAKAAETGGGTMAKRAFAPVGHLLDAIGADARFIASRQRGEPIDVAAMRAAVPVAGSTPGGAGGATLGAAIGGSAGLGFGAAPGGIVGSGLGSYGGEKLGDLAAEGYARARRYRQR